MPRAADLPIVPRDNGEALIDLRRRYARCVRMVWTLIGVNLALAVALAVIAVAAATA